MLANTVTSATTGSNCPVSGGTDPSCTATVNIADLTIVNTADVATTTPGGIVRYTIVATNTGQVPISDATFAAGLLGAVAQRSGAVTMTVTCNSPDGYQVTVQPATPDLTSAGSTGTIPFGDLNVRETGQAPFESLAVPVLVHNQSGPSAPAGDLISNDYAINVPDVQSGSYQGTLDYIATATP